MFLEKQNVDQWLLKLQVSNYHFLEVLNHDIERMVFEFDLLLYELQQSYQFTIGQARKVRTYLKHVLSLDLFLTNFIFFNV